MKTPAFLRASLLVACALPSLYAETPAEWAGQHWREAAKENMPGVAVLVARDGQVLFQGGFGLADLEKKTLITPETKFRIGSVTKQFTAAAILKLAEEGKLAITDSLAKYFPELPNAKIITLRHLLTHTSGLHSFTDRPGLEVAAAKPIKPEDLIASMQKEAPDFEPGAKFKYCNSGYFLLGEIVAKVSGQSLADYLRTSFFEPLGMKDTGIYVNATPPPGAALGYSVRQGEAKAAPEWDMSWTGGAGCIYSTVGDLWRWTEGLHAGRVINADSLKAMTTANPLPAGSDGLNYGFGLVIGELAGLPAISHNGGLPGWSSNLAWLPRQHVTLVALANALPPAPALQPAAVTNEMARHFLADDIAKLQPPAEAAVDPWSYADYVGRYDYGAAILTVSVEHDHLFGQLTGQAKYEIFPKGPDEFFWKVTEASVVFLRDDGGAVFAARHSQNGNILRALRLDDAVKFTPEQLDAFVGQYQYGPLAVLTVRRDDQQLFAQLTGQPEFPIFPTGPDDFEWRVVKASIHFMKGEDGKLIKAVHTQNGTSFDAPKMK